MISEGLAVNSEEDISTIIMNNRFKGTVIKQVGGIFSVRVGSETINIYARGKLKQNGVIVGDEVETDGKVILSIHKRKNQLIRPIISNVDQIIIVVSQIPEPDFTLIDKLIIYANINKINTIICVNKIEESQKLYEDIQKQYSDVVYSIVKTSAINGKIEELLPLLQNNISVFAGQSAVGKSTLLNAIFSKNMTSVGELSKIERGKNTTRETILYTLNENSFIADTPGFSCLELINFSPEQVTQGYTEFEELSNGCKYRQCDHIYVDKCDCGVLEKLEENSDILPRYQRYKELYNQVRENWRNRYGK